MKRVCDRFRELMLDLAYDELEPEIADQLRGHAAECAGCREELESILLTRKLASQLPDPEPPTLRDAEILELAAAAASEHAEASRPLFDDVIRPQRPASVEPPVPFLDRLRGLLLRPALVTAAVASVVFVVSYFVGSNIIDSGGMDRASESGAPFVGPAVPMDSTADRAPAQRAGLPGETSSATLEREKGPAVAVKQDLQPAENLGTGGKLKGAPRGGSLGTAAPLPQNSAAQLSPQPAPPVMAAPSAPPAQGYDEAEPADDADSLTGLGSADFPAKAEAKAKAAAPSGPQVLAEEGEVYEGDDARHYRDGMAAYNRGDCAVATISLRKVVDPPHDAPSLVAPALHHLARCEKRTGRCGKAVVAYDELLNRFPGYQGRSEAMWEAAGCHRRLGHIDRAWALLESLAQIPAWRERARTEQQNLEQLKTQE